MMKRCNGSSRSKICSKAGTSTDRSSFVRELVHELQTELAGSGDHDGRPRHFRDGYNDSRVGPALPAGVREALAALRSTRRGSWRFETYINVHGQRERHQIVCA